LDDAFGGVLESIGIAEVAAQPDMGQSPDPNVELVSKGIIAFVTELKKGAGKDIYLCGGADLAGRLFAEALIDEPIVKLNPVLFGSGIPLMSGMAKQTDLELTGTKAYGNGVVLLNYRVEV
jgi:dihydrofolate reductase